MVVSLHHEYRLTSSWIIVLFLNLPTQAQRLDSGGDLVRRRVLRTAVANVRAVCASVELDDERVALEQLLAKHILDDDSSMHVDPMASREACFAFAQKAQNDKLRKDIARIITWCKERSSLVSEEVLSRELGLDLDDQIDRANALYLEKHFDSAFNNARATSVDLQFGEIERQLSVKLPSKVFIENELRNDPVWARHHDKFAAHMRRNALPEDAIVFQENEPRLGDVIDGVLTRAEQSYAEQLLRVKQYADLQRALPDKLKTAAEIEQLIGQDVATLAEDEQHVYGVFQAVGAQVESAAKALEGGCFEDSLSNWQPVKRGELEEKIWENLAVHRTKEVSHKAFLKDLPDTLAPAAIEAYLGNTSAPDRDKAEERLRKLLTTNKLRKCMRERISRALEDILPKARGSVAMKQVQPCLDRLRADWWPSVALLERRYHQHQELPRSLKEVGDLMETEAAARRVDLSPLKTITLLDEVEELIVEAARQRLAAGQEVLIKQLGIVRDLESEHAADLMEAVRHGEPARAIFTRWKAQLDSLWKEQASKQYPIVFPIVEHELQKVVRQHYTEIEDKIAATREEQRRRARAPAARERKSQPAPRSRHPLAARQTPRAGGQSRDGGAAGAGNEGGSGTGGQGGIGLASLKADLNLLENVAGVGYGEGPSPDVVLTFTDTATYRSIASVRLLSPDALLLAETDVIFDPRDVEASAAGIAEPAWETLVQAGRSKLAAAQGGAVGEEREAQFELVVAVRVESARLRHKTTLLLYEALRKRLRGWSDQHASGLEVRLLWIDYLGRNNSK